ncbi:MAG: leucyl aminopeptidase [Chloroflexi bacterium]|nr:leucyl aminopeptidase [Chloroflexota bacterium]
MDVIVKQGNVTDEVTDALVVSLFEGTTSPGGGTGAVDRALDGMVSQLIANGDIRGKLKEVTVLYPAGKIPAQRVLVVGLGKQETFGYEQVRQAAAAAAQRARDLGATLLTSIAHGAGTGGLDPAMAAQATVEGTVLGTYQLKNFKSNSSNGAGRMLQSLTILEASAEKMASVANGTEAGQIIAQATCLARDLGNTPGNIATPTYLARVAQDIAAETGMRIEILEQEDTRKLGMGAFVGVSLGSEEPAKFIVMEHNAGKADLPTIVLIGKGITFDSGGISIKPSEKMEEMKYDMCGGGAVLGAMQAVGRLGLPLHVVGIVPASENLPSSTAMKPGDILTAMNGKTIEIISTDAEGRLVLADSLCYAARYQPAAVVDLATLTGAITVALGNQCAGMFGSGEELKQHLSAAAQVSGDRVWELPLYPEYADQIKSEWADMKNSGGRLAGSITAAAFLANFAEGYPWVHLDIAGVAWTTTERGYNVKGATGFGVRLLVEMLRTWHK